MRATYWDVKIKHVGKFNWKKTKNETDSKLHRNNGRYIPKTKYGEV